MAMLEGNHNVALMEQFSPSVMQVEVATRESLTWPSSNHMGYNQYPLDDIFELSRLFAYTLSSPGHQKASQDPLNQSTPPKLPPPSAQMHASDSAYQAPSWLRVDDEHANWLGDDPTSIEGNSVSQGLSEPMDLQGSLGFPSLDLPEFVETSPFSCMQPYTEPTLAKANASLAQATSSSSSSPKDDQAILMDVSFPEDLAKTPLNHTGDMRNTISTGVCFLPKTSVYPTTCDQRNLSNMKIVKEIQLSQRVDDDCYHLSIEDTKRITLKVSKVSNSNHQDKASGCDRMRGDSMHVHEKPINIFPKQGPSNSLQVSNGNQKVVNLSTEERSEKVDETFEDCLALDLQDIAPLGSLVNTQFGAPKIGYTLEASSLQDVAALSFDNDLSLSASLSTLSTNDHHSPLLTCSENMQIRDYPTNCQINPINYQHAQPLDSLPLTDHPYPYICDQDPIANNCWDLSCMYPNTQVMTSAFPTDTTCVFNPDINQSEASRMHAHYTSHNGACYFPSNKLNEQERIAETLNQGLLPLTRSSFSQNKFTNLHWSSPAAKTRAARKRRMARKLFHIVPYQACPSSSSLTWSKPKNAKERDLDNAPKTSLVLQKKSDGQISCVDDKTKLRFLLQKRLKPSDVGTLGRIILPKRDAEAYLPRLNEREGRVLQMEDIHGSHIWHLKFRYWPNNKSRMYLLDHTREFVNYYKLREGDYVMLYRDDFAGKYVIRTKRFIK